MKNHRVAIQVFLFWTVVQVITGQQTVFPGADETTPSRAQYFSWINNTNEGATEEHTLINLDFFEWLKTEYGMHLDIYAFDAGAIDGAKFYGSTKSERFKRQFPNGFDPIYEKAKNLGTRLGVWGGPDGFGNTPEQRQVRIDEMVELCRKYEFELFKFDKVCGPLPLEKEEAFIEMMKECRKFSPDLILLNHRLGLKEGLPYATTFLWEGIETYTDCHIWNETTAPHHRAGALTRGFPPGFSRLTEDHGVCISSCLDAWDDELILQAFNRNLILAPEIYGNPWLLNDDEYAKLARIFNLHRQYRDIMVNGKILPKENYGPYAVSRGNGQTRLITLRNNSWETTTYTISLDEEIGIADNNESVKVFSHHPNEFYYGSFEYGESVDIEVLPFKTCLIRVSSEEECEPYVKGTEYQLVRNVKDKSIVINLLGAPGSNWKFTLGSAGDIYTSATLDGKKVNGLLDGRTINVRFEGDEMENEWHRKLANARPADIPADAMALYESTCFAADNNALEVRSLQRSGATRIPEVQAARDAFFNQNRFVERGVWDKYLFDGDEATSFYVCRRRYKDFRINGGCLRIDMGRPTALSQLILKVPDVYALQPLEPEEGIYAYVSNDLQEWEQVSGFIADNIEINFPADKMFRYIKIPRFPDRITEIIGLDAAGMAVNRENWRASNLFADFAKIEPQSAWKASFELNEMQKGAYICVAVNGEHGNEGAYAALKVGEKYVGAPDRSISYPSNTWESGVCHKDVVTGNYTYYFPIEEWMLNKEIEAVVLVNSDAKELNPEVWLTASNKLPLKKTLILNK
ncbi:hypothetical protein [Carboxylicivirga taeanensis]|uniref:hypothetical protein n=1 Tax=Carboxylicivirga taeanensis TaxID=1416875 RepID=UPI003F6E08A0